MVFDTPIEFFPWTAKKYTIIFNKYLSDPSGNNLIKPFGTTSIKKSYIKHVAKKINFKVIENN